MPRYGNVNERRNQLHEVIRLSGMNIIIDDADHPLIIKVASIQQARMQIYFIDNEDYFQRKRQITDKSGKFFEDNDERSIFFCRGVLETVKKLGWSPDIIHCHGWMTNLVPLYVKKVYKDNPLFADSKIIYSVYDDDFEPLLHSDFGKKVKQDGITNKDLEYYKSPSFVNITKAAVEHSDALVVGSEKINDEVGKFIQGSGKPVLPYQDTEAYIEAYSSFYDEILDKE
jgi:starch synthase